MLVCKVEYLIKNFSIFLNLVSQIEWIPKRWSIICTRGNSFVIIKYELIAVSNKYEFSLHDFQKNWTQLVGYRKASLFAFVEYGKQRMEG